METITFAAAHLSVGHYLPEYGATVRGITNRHGFTVATLVADLSDGSTAAFGRTELVQVAA
jgi:hypothetical protein